MHGVVEEIHDLLAIVERLRSKFPGKRFTLDGRLVGDLGEVLARATYDLILEPGLPRHHDAVSGDGRKVQIKATMQNALTFPGDHVPDYYLGLKIRHDGTVEEIFNGPAKLIAAAIEHRTRPKNNLHSIGLSTLRRLSQQVIPSERIRRR